MTVPPKPTDWAVVVLAVIAGMIAAAHVGKLPPALPGIRADLGLSLVTGGWIVSVFAATATVLGIAAGSIADRIGHRRLTLIGLGALTVGSLNGALADGPMALITTRILEGLGFVSVVVAAPSLIVSAARGPRLRLALGLWSTYMPAGSALMILLAPLALGEWGWRGLWLVIGGLSGLWMAVLLLRTKNDRAPGGGEAPASLWRNIRLTAALPGPWLLALIFAFYTVQWISLMVWLPTYLIEQRGLVTGTAAALTALVVAANLPGNLGGGWLLHRGVPRWRLIAVASVAMGGCAILIFSGEMPDWVRLAACLVFSAAGGMLPSAVLLSAPVVAPTPSQIGTTNGMLIQGSNVGQLVGPPAIAAVVAASGAWESAGGLMAGSAAAAVLLSLLVRRIERRAVGARFRS